MEKELTREEKIKLVKQDITKTHIMKMFEELVNELPEISEDDITSGDYVDLGLPSGLKWATCNLGATIPCEYGLFYQFGRVDGYIYGDTNHQFRTKEQNTEDTGSEYIPKTTSGKTYTAGDVLDPADDAAYIASNGKMRMPTAEEMEELFANTTSQWVSCSIMEGDHTSHEVMGLLFTSTKNNNTLFFPATGAYYGNYGSFYYAGSFGACWCSSVWESDTNKSRYLSFSSEGFGCYERYRYFGLPVRGVRNN